MKPVGYSKLFDCSLDDCDNLNYMIKLCVLNEQLNKRDRQKLTDAIFTAHSNRTIFNVTMVAEHGHMKIKTQNNQISLYEAFYA